MTEKKEYKNKVVFLRKSRKGEHLYAFDNEDAFAVAESIVMNISDVKALIEGKFDSIKVSIMEMKEKSTKEVGELDGDKTGGTV